LIQIRPGGASHAESFAGSLIANVRSSSWVVALRSARKESSSLLAGTSWDLRAIVSISTSRTARLPTHVEAHGFQALGRRGDADIVAAFGRFAQVASTRGAWFW
jgi:hypothetical protein